VKEMSTSPARTLLVGYDTLSFYCAGNRKIAVTEKQKPTELRINVKNPWNEFCILR